MAICQATGWTAYFSRHEKPDLERAVVAFVEVDGEVDGTVMSGSRIVTFRQFESERDCTLYDMRHSDPVFPAQPGERMLCEDGSSYKVIAWQCEHDLFSPRLRAIGTTEDGSEAFYGLDNDERLMDNWKDIPAEQE